MSRQLAGAQRTATGGHSLLGAFERVIVEGQPFVFAAAAVLSRYDSVPSVPTSLLRPMIVALVVTGILLLLARNVLRSPALASILTSAIVLFTFREIVPAMALFAVVIWWMLIRLLLRQRSGKAPPVSLTRLARLSGAISLGLLALSAASVAYGMIVTPEVHSPTFAVSGSGGPNVYVILLDGYPRSDTLEDTFGYDNSAFTGALDAAGFTVSGEARSNYRKTWVTLASMFNGTYVEDLLHDQEVPESGTAQIRWLSTMIDRAAILDAFRARGYEISTVPSSFTSASLTSADVTHDTGAISELEANIIARSPWTLVFRDPVMRFLADAHAHAVRNGLSTTADIAEADEQGPRFTFTHILSPHTPFVVHEDPEADAGLSPCFPTSCSVWSATMDELGIDFEEYRSGFVQEVEALNALVIDTVDRIVTADPEAIIVIMSDHGSRYTLSDPDEHFRSFLAARSPGEPLYGADESPTNVLRSIVRAAFGGDVASLPYRAWMSDWCCPLNLSVYQPRAAAD